MTEYLSGIAGVIGFISAVFKSIVIVQEGELGTKTTFGALDRHKNGDLKLLKPGFNFVMPFVQQVKKVHLKTNTYEIKDLSVTLKNKLSYNFKGFITLHIIAETKPIENILYTIENYVELITVSFEKEIQKILNKSEIIDTDTINKELFDSIYSILIKEGIEVTDCGLVNFTLTPQSEAMLALNYKIDIVKSNNDLNDNILCSLLGAISTVQVQDKKEEIKPIQTNWLGETIKPE